MEMERRKLVAGAGALTAMTWLKGWAENARHDQSPRMVLSSFLDGESFILPGAGWRGFSDRVMGGISTAQLETDRIAGKDCLRLTGNVTRESNGGFIQMALYFGRNYAEFNGSAYKGVELLVYGNNEDYNVHIRTSECRWYDQSYRKTFFAAPEWQRIRIPWESFSPNNAPETLNAARLQRIAVLGWMREFSADIALAEIALYS